MTRALDELMVDLLRQPGLPGGEHAVRTHLAALWEPLSDVIETSRLGSLHAVRMGRDPLPHPALLLAAHMDAIGLLVSAIEGEVLHISPVGGIDARILPGQRVIVYGRQPLPGIIVQLPDHLRSDDSDGFANLRVDTGLPARSLQRLVQTGDLVVFAQEPLDLGGEVIAGPALDNRASLAALTYCFQTLQKTRLGWDVWAVATVQEEITGAGALTSAFELEPALAVAIDVTYGSTPDSPDHQTFPLDGGITLGWGPDVHPGLYQAFAELADQLEIPWQMEVMPVRSGTDATRMQTSASGVPTMVLSIPVRYMHTPVEMVHLADIRRAGRLLAAFASHLDQNFMQRLAWNP